MIGCAIIPVFNEVRAVADAIDSAPRDLCQRVVVVDGGSEDGTVAAATAAGAQVVVEANRGYGRAVARGIRAATAAGAEVYVIFDGNGCADAADIRRVLEPVVEGRADVSIGWRARHHLRPIQYLGNRLAVEMIQRMHGVRFEDIGSIRAVRADTYAALGVDDLGYGWPLQLLARAAAQNVRIAQCEITPRIRIGRSKVSGTLTGTLGASVAFVRVLFREWVS